MEHIFILYQTSGELIYLNYFTFLLKPWFLRLKGHWQQKLTTFSIEVYDLALGI